MLILNMYLSTAVFVFQQMVLYKIQRNVSDKLRKKSWTTLLLKNFVTKYFSCLMWATTKLI